GAVTPIRGQVGSVGRSTEPIRPASATASASPGGLSTYGNDDKTSANISLARSASAFAGRLGTDSPTTGRARKRPLSRSKPARLINRSSAVRVGPDASWRSTGNDQEDRLRYSAPIAAGGSTRFHASFRPSNRSMMT